jgi:hypothetical protein
MDRPKEDLRKLTEIFGTSLTETEPKEIDDMGAEDQIILGKAMRGESFGSNSNDKKGCGKKMGYRHLSGVTAYCGDDVGTHIVYCKKCDKCKTLGDKKL